MENDASDATIVHSTIDLARNLGLETVAEGVESQVAWAALDSFGCKHAQGWFISKAVSVEELDELMSSGSWATRQVVESDRDQHLSLADPVVSV